MLRKALSGSLQQLSDILTQLDQLPGDAADSLFTSLGIGRHLRHSCDHLVALRRGMETGTVDYNQRNRDCAEERDRTLSARQLEDLQTWIAQYDPANLPLRIISEVDCLQVAVMQFKSNLSREILYLINHNIHHAAHIRIALAGAGVQLPEHIGIAPGTATHLRLQAADQSCVH